jgi:hypothetical protein
MKNGDLVVQGKRVDELDLNSFTTAEQMCEWVFDPDDGAYAAYENMHGKGACDDFCVEDLTDMFGKEFNDQFYGHRAQLVARMAIPALEREISQLTQLLDKARVLAIAEEPREDASYYSRLIFWSTK